MVNRVHVVDPDVRRRARVARELSTRSLHVEIYEDIREFLDIAPREGVVLAANSAFGHRQSLGDFIRTAAIDLPVVAYGDDPAVEEVVEAMTAGAAGFLRWPFGDRELLKTLGRIAGEGDQRLRRERLLSRARSQVEALSRREKQVLTLLIGGLSNRRIAEALEISPRTVEIHRSNMMTKLRARSVADAVKTGLYAGLDEDLSSLMLDRAA